MEFTTHLELQSQATRLVEGTCYGTRNPNTNGSVTLSAALFQGTLFGTAADDASTDHNSAHLATWRRRGCTDSHGELFLLQSPLLEESWLVSFPPLNYMLKFSGYSYLT